MRKLCFLLIVISLLISRNASAFDNKTHPRLTDEAIESSKLKVILTDSLNCPDGAETSVNGLTIRNWLKRGSTLEDVPMCRASNHFHNPRRGWDVSGMRDQPWFVDWHCSESEYPPGNIKSNVRWATGYMAPPPGGSKDPIGNQWDWDHAREFYCIYLTGKDSQGNPVASTEDEREIYFAKFFQALGQVLHLLQEMAVPAHVRDDFKSHLDFQGITVDNLFSPAQWFGDNFEYYVGENIEEWLTGGSQIEFTEPSITEFWDTDKYSGQDPDLLISQMIGLAEYTNMNFASNDTVFAEDFLNDSASYNDVYYHPYPRKSSTNVQELLDENLLPKTVISEDGKVDTGFWIEKTGDGVGLDHFVKPTYFTKEIQREPDSDERVLNRTFRIDIECAREYASKLLPRAVGYSAGLLDYFFRGKLEVEFVDGGLRITNKSEENMHDGYFELYYDNAEGERQAIEIYSGAEVTALQPDGEQTITFDPPGDAKSHMLVYRGALGNETDAVVGKVIEAFKSYLLITVFSNQSGEARSIIWDITEDHYAEIKDNDGNIILFPCFQDDISDWVESTTSLEKSYLWSSRAITYGYSPLYLCPDYIAHFMYNNMDCSTVYENCPHYEDPCYPCDVRCIESEETNCLAASTCSSCGDNTKHHRWVADVNCMNDYLEQRNFGSEYRPAVHDNQSSPLQSYKYDSLTNVVANSHFRTEYSVNFEGISADGSGHLCSNISELKRDRDCSHISPIGTVLNWKTSYHRIKDEFTMTSPVESGTEFSLYDFKIIRTHYFSQFAKAMVQIYFSQIGIISYPDGSISHYEWGIIGACDYFDAPQDQDPTAQNKNAEFTSALVQLVNTMNPESLSYKTNGVFLSVDFRK